MLVLQSYLASPRVKKALRTKPGQAGFSLIELVVVIAILGILIAIALPNFLNVQKDAKINQAKTTLANLVKECSVAEAREKDTIFFTTTTDDGNLGEYKVASFTAPEATTDDDGNVVAADWDGANVARDNAEGSTADEASCYAAAAVPGEPTSGPGDWKLPGFAISYNSETGAIAKYCALGTASGHYDSGCDPAKNAEGTAW